MAELATMTLDRFAYSRNLERATGYRDWRNALWPPASDHRLFCLDLAGEVPGLGPEFAAELETLRAAIDAEWLRSKSAGDKGGGARMHGAPSIARCLHRIADLLPEAADQRALRLRADAVERGYDDGALSALTGIDEALTVVAGRISTWYGKQTRGLPTAFGCLRDRDRQASVVAAGQHLGEVAEYLRGLLVHLRLGEVPAFSATRLFFMAGEGNRHPKHIAYFLPEDEGVKRSPFKKTYYFANTHAALLDAVSLPLARRLLDVGGSIPASAAALGPIPTLGVMAHEIGHFVHREGVTFAELNAANRWASVTLQETAADVFGILVLAEVLAPALGLDPGDVVSYHLAECLRYVDRGLGCFPDSDGMYLQLNYLASFGALTVDPGRQLVADREVVVAGFRSLARVFADTLLAGDIGRTLALYRAFGPASGGQLDPLIAHLREGPQKSIEYLQEAHVANGSANRRVSTNGALSLSPADESVAEVAMEDPIRDFYCRRRRTSSGGPALTRYQIWERGEAVEDSVTPSCYCPEYRAHMVLKILSLCKQQDRVFSIGCGNAFVEAELSAKGLQVHAIDCNEEAVALATSKGVDAFASDYGALPPGHLASFGAVYADGLLGHLYRPDSGLDGFFATLLALKPRPGAWLIFSNDAPPAAGVPVAPHGALGGFWLFSRDYLSQLLTRFGFVVWESYQFPYERPLSGLRNRTICIARVPGPVAAAE
jgi:hypothetical protein